jgi:hypothetical protein
MDDIKYILHEVNGSAVVEVVSDKIIIQSEQDALDIMVNVSYQHHCRNIILHKENIHQDFFQLKTGLAGNILQKFVNYSVRLAIVGDFTVYKSKSLNDFIRESNKGSQIFFCNDLDAALKALSCLNE